MLFRFMSRHIHTGTFEIPYSFIFEKAKAKVKEKKNFK